MDADISLNKPIELCPNCGHTVQLNLRSIASPSRLRSNYIPENDDVEAVIATAEAELKKCEAEISRVEHILRELNAQKVEINRIADENRSLLAPIRRLPVELLSNIFEHCLPIFTNDMIPLFEMLKGSILRTPFQIATTCHFWREIAMSSPSLWSRIVLDLGSTRETTADILDTFLRRSGDHNLYLFLKTDTDANKRITSLLATYFFRISHMKLMGHSDPFLDISTSGFPFAQLAAFNFTHSAGQGLDPFPWLTSATQLRSVMINDVLNTLTVPEFLNGISNENVSFLAAYHAYPSHSLYALQRFCNIREGVIQVDEPDEDLDEDPEHGDMQLLKLQTLSLCRSDFAHQEIDIRPYLTSLTLPSLSTLQLTNVSTQYSLSWTKTDFASFLSRSGIADKITTFELRGYVGTSDQQLIETLELLPAIATLVLYEYDPPPTHTLAIASLLARLAVDNEHEPLLPALVNLRVCFYHRGGDVSHRLSLLVSLVKSRCSKTRPPKAAFLQELWFKLVSYTSEESINDLVECRLLGLRVHAEIVSHNDRLQWMENCHLDWYDF